MARICTLVCALVLITILLPAPARPEEALAAARDSMAAPRVGVIGGHAFIPSSFIRDPFVRTYLQTGLGFGSTTNFVPPPTVINGKTLPGPKGSLMYAVMDMEFQYAIRSWLAVRGRFDVTGRMATETPTLIKQGVTLYSGFDLGWLFRVAESEQFSMSGSLGVKNSSTTDVFLQRFIEGIIENGEVLPGNKLVAATPTLRGTAGFHSAWTLSRLTGLTVEGNLDYGESMNRNEGDKWYYGISAAFDFNLFTESGVPVGFVVGGTIASAPDLEGIDSRSAQSIFGRIAYTGAEQFALGLDLAYRYFPIRGLEEKQNFLSAVIDIRLFF
jgi:hypothetical protein